MGDANMMRGFFRVEKPGPLWAIWLWSCFILKGGKKAYTTGSCCLIQTYCLAWGCKLMECNLRLLWKKRNEQLVGSLILFPTRCQKVKNRISPSQGVLVVSPVFFSPFGGGVPLRIFGSPFQAYLGPGRGEPHWHRSWWSTSQEITRKSSQVHPAKSTHGGGLLVGFLGLVFLAFFCWAPQKSQIIRYRKWMEMVVEHHWSLSIWKNPLFAGCASHHLCIQKSACEERFAFALKVYHLWSTLCSSVGVGWIYWPATLVGFEAVGHQNFLNGVYTACRTC